MKPHRPSVFADAVPVDGRGHRSWNTKLLIDERDRYLIEAAKFYPGCRDREVARRLRSALAIYRAGRWRRDCSEALCPHAAGTVTAALWRLLKVCDAVPSDRLIRGVLAQSTAALEPMQDGEDAGGD